MVSFIFGPQLPTLQQHEEEEVESSHVVCDVEVKVKVKVADDDGDRSQILSKIEAEVERVMSHMTAHKQGIFLWNLSTLTLLQLQASSWDSFGFSIPNNPSLNRLLCAESKVFKNSKGSVGRFISTWKDACKMYTGVEVTSYQQAGHDFNELEAVRIIDSIRREEFGLNPNLSYSENTILKKQHARLGRALDCLSQELYSHDSHFLLELVQNADDNMYPENLEPTLTFIFQPTSIVVLNNERGFTAENMRALCDIGNSTKKGSSTGHIGHK